MESEYAQRLESSFRACGDVTRKEEEPDYFSQPGDFWRNVLDDAHRTRTMMNIANAMRAVRKDIQERAIEVFRQVDEDLGRRLREELL